MTGSVRWYLQQSQVAQIDQLLQDGIYVVTRRFSVAQSQHCGRGNRSYIQEHLDRGHGRDQPSSRTSIYSFMWGGTRRGLPQTLFNSVPPVVSSTLRLSGRHSKCDSRYGCAVDGKKWSLQVPQVLVQWQGHQKKSTTREKSVRRDKECLWCPSRISAGTTTIYNFSPSSLKWLSSFWCTVSFLYWWLFFYKTKNLSFLLLFSSPLPQSAQTQWQNASCSY